MTDQTESASEYAELLAKLDRYAAIIPTHAMTDKAGTLDAAAAAIRALEAKVQDLECQLDAESVSDMRNELAHVRVDRDGIAARLETYRDKWNSASADRDRLAGEVERLKARHEYARKFDSLDVAQAEVARLTAELAAAREDAYTKQQKLAALPILTYRLSGQHFSYLERDAVLLIAGVDTELDAARRAGGAES